MKSITEMGLFIKDLIEFESHNNELKIISEVENYYCKKQKLEEKENYKTAFIINGVNDFSGGSTSILRLGTYLHQLGHDIYYITYDGSKKKQMEKSAANNLPNYEGTILEKSSLCNEKFDIGIATFWLSCYALLACQHNFDYKMYFIQDFEPYFYAMGDVYYLALNTYKFGFYMVSLGKWNKSIIEQKTSVNVDYVDFPVELGEYKLQKRKISINNVVTIALYLKLDSRRAPLLLIQQINYLHEKLSKSGYKIKIYAFGLNKHIKLPFITNLGKLKTKELIGLYKECHFGLVASLTNISLVNYEMLLSGLPVIDLADGSAPTFFSEEEMIFIKSNIDDLYNKIIHYINHQDELNRILETAQDKIINNELLWENSSKQFNDIIRRNIRDDL
jgi:hypothetical protein